MTPILILASGSATRAQMLRDAGIPFDQIPGRIDEESVKHSAKAEGLSASDTAEMLAELKAQQISRKQPGGLVLGADQILEVDGRFLSKPDDRAAAREQLWDLRGREHRLVTSAVLVRDGTRLWHATQIARLTLRAFTEDALDQWLDHAGDAVTSSVGGYQIEGPAAQLFARIHGDWFAILGLPLLPLIGILVEHGVVKR